MLACVGDMDAATHTGKPIGKKTSTAYSPPELARVRASGSEQLQIASTSFDVWSLGVMLFELCTGRTLFRQDTSNDDLLKAAALRASLLSTYDSSVTTTALATKGVDMTRRHADHRTQAEHIRKEREKELLLSNRSFSQLSSDDVSVGMRFGLEAGVRTAMILLKSAMRSDPELFPELVTMIHDLIGDVRAGAQGGGRACVCVPMCVCVRCVYKKKGLSATTRREEKRASTRTVGTSEH